jgi:hypothetical protein
LGVKKPALYYFLSDFASSNLTAVGGVFPAREDKIFVDVDLEKRSFGVMLKMENIRGRKHYLASENNR